MCDVPVYVHVHCASFHFFLGFSFDTFSHMISNFDLLLQGSDDWNEMLKHTLYVPTKDTVSCKISLNSIISVAFRFITFETHVHV